MIKYGQYNRQCKKGVNSNMKITEKVKCKICGDIITLKNNDKYVECKEVN